MVHVWHASTGLRHASNTIRSFVLLCTPPHKPQLHAAHNEVVVQLVGGLSSEASAYASIRHSIRQHTAAYASIRQHTFSAASRVVNVTNAQLDCGMIWMPLS